MTATVDKIDTQATVRVLDAYQPLPTEQFGSEAYPYLVAALRDVLPDEINAAIDRFLSRRSALVVCDCGHASHPGRTCPGEPTGGYCGHDGLHGSGPTPVFDDCLLEGCTHPHDPERGCMIVVEDDDGERPCHARPTCGVCGGTGWRTHVHSFTGRVTEQTCPGCGGLGLS